MPCCGGQNNKGCQKSVGKRRVKVQVSPSSAVDKTASESSVAVSKDESSDDEAPSVPECSCTAAVQTEEILEKVALANAMACEKKDQGCDACELPAPCATDDSDVGACGENKEMKLKALMMEKALHFLSCNVIQGLNELDKIELEGMMEKAETGVCPAECPEISHPIKLDRAPVLKKLCESLDFIEQQELKSVLFLKDMQRKRWSETIEAKAPEIAGCCMEVNT